MSMSRKQKATFNAALCMILDGGHDLAAVTRDIDLAISIGTPPQLAYARALSRFVERTPSMLAPLQSIVKLIDASSPRTVGEYNLALSHYIETGDDSALRALAPTIARDMTELAARTGQAAPQFSDEMDALVAAAHAADAGEAPPPTPAQGEASDGPAPFQFASRVEAADVALA